MNITVTSYLRQILLNKHALASSSKDERGISADTAIRFSKFFGTSPEFWMNLQREYDLRKVRFEIKEIIDNIHSSQGNLFH